MAAKDPAGVDTTELGPSDSTPYSKIPRLMTAASDTEHTSLDDDTSNVSDSEPNGSPEINTSTCFPVLDVAAELRADIMEQAMPTRSASGSQTGTERPEPNSTIFHILPCCTHADRSFLPYQITLFELGDIRDAMMFFATLSPSKLANIRKVRIECKLGSLHYTGRMDWNYHPEWMAFCAFAQRALTDLRELYIDLIGWGYDEYHASTPYSLDDWHVLLEILDMDNAWVKALVQLRNLPLSKVTILPDNGGQINTDTMVEEQRVNFANTITRTLLRQ